MIFKTMPQISHLAFCGGQSKISSDTFDLNMEITQNTFETIIASTRREWLTYDSEIRFSMQFSMGFIRGYYGEDDALMCWLRQTGSAMVS